jgi:tryptophan synthase beta chain
VSGAGLPDERGRFGEFGGRFVPETVLGALDELAAGYAAAQADPSFAAELEQLARDYVGRPSPLYLAERLSEESGARIYLKREDLNHTGAHKINNAVGQALLATRLGKQRIVAWRRPPCAPASGSNASSTWARRTSAASTRTSFGCTCWGPR